MSSTRSAKHTTPKKRPDKLSCDLIGSWFFLHSPRLCAFALPSLSVDRRFCTPAQITFALSKHGPVTGYQKKRRRLVRNLLRDEQGTPTQGSTSADVSAQCKIETEQSGTVAIISSITRVRVTIPRHALSAEAALVPRGELHRVLLAPRLLPMCTGIAVPSV